MTALGQGFALLIAAVLLLWPAVLLCWIMRQKNRAELFKATQNAKMMLILPSILLSAYILTIVFTQR